MKNCGCKGARGTRGSEMAGSNGEQRDPHVDLYRNIIMGHYRSSPHRHPMEDPSFRSGQVNRVCGDRIELFVRIDEGRILEASFTGEGCSLCISGASILCQELKGLSIHEALALKSAFIDYLAGDTPEFHDQRGSSDALSALGSVRSYGARIPCVLLSWNILDSLPGKA